MTHTSDANTVKPENTQYKVYQRSSYVASYVAIPSPSVEQSSEQCEPSGRLSDPLLLMGVGEKCGTHLDNSDGGADAG